MAGFEFPNETARIAVFATLGSLIFLIVTFILTLIIRICCCATKRKKSPERPGTVSQPVQPVAVVQPQRKVTPKVTPELKKKEEIKSPPTKEEISPEPVKKRTKPSVQFNDENEVVPNQRISYTENAYEEINQTPEYADTDDVSRSEHPIRREPGNHAVLSPGDFTTPKGQDVVIGPQIVPMGVAVPNQDGQYIPQAPPPPVSNNMASQQVVSTIETGTYPPNHGHRNGTVTTETEEIHSSTVPAKVRKAKKGAKRYITPKRFRGKGKKKEAAADAEGDVMPALFATTFMIPEEDRMY